MPSPLSAPSALSLSPPFFPRVFHHPGLLGTFPGWGPFTVSCTLHLYLPVYTSPPVTPPRSPRCQQVHSGNQQRPIPMCWKEIRAQQRGVTHPRAHRAPSTAAGAPDEICASSEVQITPHPHKQGELLERGINFSSPWPATEFLVHFPANKVKAESLPCQSIPHLRQGGLAFGLSFLLGSPVSHGLRPHWGGWSDEQGCWGRLCRWYPARGHLGKGVNEASLCSIWE